MAWNYAQRTGKLYHNNELVASCYSGHGPGVNNPDMQAVPNVGPLPVGEYTIGPFFNDPGGKGPIVCHLTPSPRNKMYGRAGMMIHGDSSAHPGEASHGCIIVWHEARITIRDSGDTMLIVTPDKVQMPKAA
jgi:hypothetical protein